MWEDQNSTWIIWVTGVRRHFHQKFVIYLYPSPIHTLRLAIPLPAVWPSWCPSRHIVTGRPGMVTRLRYLPQPFVLCRPVVAEGRSYPLANDAYFPFDVSFLLLFTFVAFFSSSSSFSFFLLHICDAWSFPSFFTSVSRFPYIALIAIISYIFHASPLFNIS